MTNYVIYSNTDYLDVLKIQTDHITGINNATLFIDENDMDLKVLYEKYNKVIFYDNSDSYATRLLKCLKHIDDDYIVFIHDIDIIINADLLFIDKLIEFSRKNSVDKIDLKLSNIPQNEKRLIEVVSEKVIQVDCAEPDVIYLSRHNNPNNVIYNVNPSIWRRSSLLEIMESFKGETYRTIERMEVQNYCMKFAILGIYSKNKKLCGYYNCINQFKFLHISHSGNFLTLNHDSTTDYGQSYNDVKVEYRNIVDKYNLTQSKKWKK